MKQLIALMTFLTTLTVFAAQPAINTYGKGGSFISDPPRTDVAIKGYDTVAYFTDHMPVKGSDDFVMTWKGARWKFASKKNLDAFTKEPDKFAPQYGGYCAYGVTKGYLVKIEPEEFKIVDGKLYLNYDKDVSEKWNKDIAGYIKTADKIFPEIVVK